MKKIILLSLLLSINYGFSQHENFSVENNYVTWTKEYASNLTKDDLFNKLNRHPIFHNIAPELSGYTELIMPKCEIKGKPIYAYYMYSVFAFIDKTPSGYKVTVNYFKFLNQTSKSNHNINFLEDLVLIPNTTNFKKGSNHVKGLTCIDQTLTELFTF